MVNTFGITRAVARSMRRSYLVRPLAAATTTNTTNGVSSTTNRGVMHHFQRPTTIHKRSMVMVTKVKVSELSELEEAIATASPGAKTYETLSDALMVTPSCLSRVERLIQQRKNSENDDDSDDAYFLRVFVDAGGCSGFQYQFEMDSEMDDEEDIVLVSANGDNPRVVVDETSLGFLKGSTLDYVQEMIKSSFVVIDNPVSESACGCGSSFAVKNFSANPALD